jgi:inosine-uridine nucleoside N-ribohydrolase
MRKLDLVGVAALAFGSLVPCLSAAAQKIIIDTDPGCDDAIAILLALNSPEVDLQAITVVAGNVTARQGLENALKLASLAKRCDIPVAAGAQQPLAQKLVTAEAFHGPNGLGGVELPAPACRVDSRFGPDLIIELVHRYPREIILVPIGPLTNIALAISKDPSIVPLVKQVVIMGGSTSGGNTSAAAEFNIFNDPEAARIVFNAGWTLTMVGLNVTEKTLFTREHLEDVKKSHEPLAELASRVLSFMLSVSDRPGRSGSAMHDPLAMGAVVDAAVITTQDRHVEVETRGEFTRGETVVSRQSSSEHRNVHVAVGVDSDRFLRLLVARLTAQSGGR